MKERDNLKEFSEDIKKHRREIDDLMRRKMPVFAGRIVVSHVQDNFRKGGFVNNGLHPWKKSNREIYGGKSASDHYGTLLSARNHLYSSTKYIPGDARVVVSNQVEYAAVHNWGGTVSPTVTPKMRKFAWAKFYALGGNKKDQPVAPDVGFWKNLALTKKSKLNIRMPQRQFLGESREMNDAVREKLDAELARIFGG
jgi:phage gpG-like protein